MRAWKLVPWSICLLWGSVAQAMVPVAPTGAVETPVPEDVPPDAPTSEGMRLENPSRFGVGLQAYAGIAGEFSSGEDRAHMVGGGLLRFRYHYFEVGGTAEITDSGESSALSEVKQEHWQAFGGFVGVFLPYYHFVDFDATLGLSSRQYKNSDRIYGPDGLSKGFPELTLRLGVSDRMSQRLVGLRIGAALAFGFDLSRADVPWRKEYLFADGTVGTTKGTTPLGGTSVGILVDIGFDVGGRASR